jgi:hypothetical protein
MLRATLLDRGQPNSSRAPSVYRRLIFLALAVVTIVIGLTVHLHGDVLGDAGRDFAGDVIWASMIAWLIAAMAPQAALWSRVLVATGICFAVEASQLYHAPALDALRHTTMGALVLGSGFDARDLLAYTAGVLGAAAIERIGRKLIAR